MKPAYRRAHTTLRDNNRNIHLLSGDLRPEMRCGSFLQSSKLLNFLINGADSEISQKTTYTKIDNTLRKVCV